MAPVGEGASSRPEGPGYAGLSPRSLLARAAGSASVYTFGVFGVRAVEFLLLPLYWALLPPREYGILAVATILVEFLRAIFGFGLPEAISRFYWEWEPDERPRRVGAIWSTAWLGSGVLAIGLLASGPALLAPLIRQVPYEPYLSLAVLVALGASLVQVPLMVLRIMERPRLYVAGTVAVTVVGTGLAIWLIAGRRMGAEGVLLAQAVAYGGVALAYAVIMAPRVRPSLRPRLLRGVLGFSLPLVPSKLLEATATVADRFLLEKHVPLAQLGIYQAARQVGRGVEMFGYSLLTAWIPFEMRVLTERPRDGRRMVAGVATWFLFAIFVAAVALTVLAPGGIRLLGLEEYGGTVPLLPIAVLPAAVLGLSHIVIQGYIIARKTQYAWVRSGSRLVAVVVAMLVLVPRWGVPGAFAALTVAATVNGLVGYGLSQRFFPIPFEWGRIGTLTLGALAVAGVSISLGHLPALAHLAVGAALVVAYAVAIAFLVLERPSAETPSTGTPGSDTPGGN